MVNAIDLKASYETNTVFYEKLNEEEKRVLELHGKMDHSSREYQRESYVFAVLNILTIVTAIAAFKYLNSSNK